MKVIAAELPEVLILEPRVFADVRGHFQESYRKDIYAEHGILDNFVQDNLSYSRKAVLRGLHFQNPTCQAKLVHVLRGEILDVAVDIRDGSPTFGKWVSVCLSSENHRQIYVPSGFAHGFVVLSDEALVTYKVSNVYDPSAEGTVLWSDPEIGVDWSVTDPILADKDKAGLRLKDIPVERLRF